jgi:hypothetical protein
MTRCFTTALLAAMATAGSAWAWDGINVHGAVLPSDAQKVGENRYRTSEDWETLFKKFYHSTYPEAQFPRKQIVNQPGIKAVHIAFPASRTWEGLNIYQANDEIRIFLVPTEARAKRKAESKGGKK